MKNKEVVKVELGINDCIDEPVLMTNGIEKKITKTCLTIQGVQNMFYKEFVTIQGSTIGNHMVHIFGHS